MFKRNNHGYFAAIVLAVFLLSLLAVYASSAQAKEMKLSARSATLYQPDTNTFLYSKNADARLHMASTTKIMTALVTLEQARELDEVIEIDPRAVGTEGSSAYLKEGDKVTVRELLYALMLQSANDAAVALACYIGGSIESFAALMNERAAALGLENTHFDNPHGLDSKEHYTTARDLALITAEAMRHEQFTEICSTYRKTLTTGERTRTYTNHNKLLRSYDGAVGVKTGFTDESGRCLVGAAERDGLKFITVTLDAPSDWADHKALFDYGFERLECISLASVYEYSYDVTLLDKIPKTVRVSNTSELYKVLEKGDHTVKEYVHLPRFISKKVKIGEKLGYVEFMLDGEMAGRVDLIATEEAIPEKEAFKDKIIRWLFG